jgi:hypothetical protein
LLNRSRLLLFRFRTDITYISTHFPFWMMNGDVPIRDRIATEAQATKLHANLFKARTKRAGHDNRLVSNLVTCAVTVRDRSGTGFGRRRGDRGKGCSSDSLRGDGGRCGLGLDLGRRRFLDLDGLGNGSRFGDGFFLCLSRRLDNSGLRLLCRFSRSFD